MAEDKILRPNKDMPIFANGAVAADIKEFGTANNSKVIEDVLTNANALDGWSSGVGANGAPAKEWFNAVGFTLSYITSYYLQDGIADWNTNQSYYTNSYAKSPIDGELYKSLTGTPPSTPNPGTTDPSTDGTNWEKKTAVTSLFSGFKNELINGDFRISQRGDFTTPSAIVNDTYYLDRWKSVLSVITADKSQKLNQTIAAGNKANTALVTATSTASGHVGKKQIIEEFEALSGKQKTLSCWVKSNSTDARLVFYDGTTFFSSTAHTGGGAWELLTVTFTIGSTPTSASYAGVFISSNIVGNVSVTSGDFIEFSQIQLENGAINTNFEQRHISIEESLAHRYFVKSYGRGVTPGAITDLGMKATTQVAGAVWFNIDFPSEMRVTPTFTPYSPTTGASGFFSQASGDQALSTVEFSTRGGVGVGVGTISQQSKMHYIADAEL